MISAARMQELETAVEAMMKTREAEVANMGRLLHVIADLQARVMAMEKVMLRPTSPAILGPNGARVN